MTESTVQSIITAVTNLLRNQLIPVIFGIAVVVFFLGIAKYVYGASDDQKKEGRYILIWGIIVMFVMAMLWGILAFLQGELGFGTGIQVLGPIGGGDPFGPN